MAILYETEPVRLGCMDFRLEGPFDCRNAGGAAPGLRKEIEGSFLGHPERTALEITVHRDCGGIKAAAAILDGVDLGLSPESSMFFDETFVKYFRGHGFEGASADQQKMEKMEEFNRDLQERCAKEILGQIGRGDVKVSVQLVSVPKGLHADTVIVVMGKLPNNSGEIAKLSGLGEGHAYAIMATTVNGASTSLELAITVMGKSDIVFVPSSAFELKKVDELCKKPYMEGITPKIIPGYHVKKRMT